jgi:ATP-dependent RNA helicase RhlE
VLPTSPVDFFITFAQFNARLMNFENLNLNTPLRNALTDLGFTIPTPIQELSFPVIMSGKDVVGLAQTGTGKTFAYLLPILRNLKFSDQKHPRVLILVPTRELVIQVISEIEKLTRYMNFRFAGVYGGTNINTQKKIVYEGLDILVATPGRLVDLTMSGILRLGSVQKLVIDEVDEMLALGFRPQTIQILELLSSKQQNLMFSATLTEDVQQLIEDFFVDPQWVEVGSTRTPVEKIAHGIYHLPNIRTKTNMLSLLLQEDHFLTRVLVFISDKKAADRLFDDLEERFPGDIAVIHSNKSQNYRFGAIAKFREGSHKVLIATDIASRGLDIADISHVINFTIPQLPEDYIHRTGRTGRVDKQGIAISFVSENEMELLASIENLIGFKIEEKALPENLSFSNELYLEEIPAPLFDKDYLKQPTPKAPVGAFHEKKAKNKKVNLGGPKKRNPKHGKPAKPPTEKIIKRSKPRL